MAYLDHQTQIDMLSDFESETESSPNVIPPTPPDRLPLRAQKKSKDKRSSAVSRNLLQSFSKESQDLENEAPRWYYDAGLRTESQSSSSSSSGFSKSTPPENPQSHYRWSSSSAHSSRSSGSNDKATPPSHMTTDGGMLRKILEEVKSTNDKFTSKIAELEQKLEDIKPKSKQRVRPSREIREMVRKIYKVFSDEDSEDPLQWDLGASFAHTSNQELTKKIVAEAKAQCSDTPRSVLKDAVRTYFQSLVNTSRLKSGGKYEQKCALQRKKNRINRKLARRKASFAKTTSLSEGQKKTFSGCLVAEFMSSEESDEETESGSFTVRPLPWRHNRVSRLFAGLDKKFGKNQTKRSKRMSYSRVEGQSSERPCPQDVPEWMLKQQ